MAAAQLVGTHALGFLSTHNALADIVDGGEDELIKLRISELGQDDSPLIKASVYPFYDVELLKRLIISQSNLPPSINVSEMRVFFRGTELPNYRSLLCFAETKTKLHFHWCLRDASKSIGIRCLNLKPPPHLKALIADVNLGLLRGMAPRLTMDGTGGTYFMTDAVGHKVAIYKPRDEEAFAPNNPRSYEGEFGQKGFRSGAYSGEGAAREVAAYLLDSTHGGHAGVPATTKVEARHPAFCHKVIICGSGIKKKTPHTLQTFWKDGSFQEFMNCQETCGDYDPRVFAISDVHYIGILDIVLINMDRNDGNLLVANRPSSLTNDSLTIDNKVSRFRLIPIDHGLILPDTVDVGDIDLVWYEWPQSKISFSEAALQYLLSFDEKKDVHRLRRKVDIRENCLRSMRISIRLLHLGAKAKLTLNQIASLIVRTFDLQTPSIVEKAIQNALTQAHLTCTCGALICQSRLGLERMLMDLHVAKDLNRSRNSERKSKAENSPSHTSGKFDSDPSLAYSDDTDNSSDQGMNSRFFCVPRPSKKNRCLSDSSDKVLSCDRAKAAATTAEVDANNNTVSQKASSSDQESRDNSSSNPTGSKSAIISPTAKARKNAHSGNDGDAPRKSQATRRLTAFQRRTAVPEDLKRSSSTWTLLDKNGNPVPLDWENQQFEKAFFEYFEFLIQNVIKETFPEAP